MSFYRIYRPQVFEEIDTIAVREQLTSFLSKDKKNLPHAYLLTGPKGSGKTTTARLIAKLFNCQKPLKSGAPCGVCETCRAISDGRYLDVLELDGASNRGIDEIRTLRDGIALAPSVGPYKVYIIDEVHMLTTEAFNALLKTLEEPPPHAVFVLATTDLHKVPATIKSRCIHILFSRAGLSETLSALARIVKAEKIPIHDEALRLIAESSEGSFRDSVKLLEQVSFKKGTISAEMVSGVLSSASVKSIGEFITDITNRDAKKALKLVSELVKEGTDIKVFLTQCLGELEKMLVRGVYGEADIDMFGTRSLIDVLSDAYGEMKSSPIPQLPLELAVVEFCQKSQSPLAEPIVSDRPKKVLPEKQLEDQHPQEKPLTGSGLGLLTLEKLVEHWKDFIEATKPYNHSVAGFLRSSRPKAVEHGIVTIEAFYAFHQEKLADIKVRESLAVILKKLFGENVKVEVVLGKK